MAWRRVIPAAAAADELAEQYARMKGPAGNVTNILNVRSLNPAELRTHYDLYRALLFSPSELSRAQRESSTVSPTASASNWKRGANHPVGESCRCDMGS